MPLLGSRVPEAQHFETNAARVLFEHAVDAAADVAPPVVQTRFLALLARFLTRIAPRGIIEHVPLMGRVDEVLARCSGPTRREALALICAHAPNILAAMPQASAQVHALSRAVFLSSVLQPQALQRIEQALREDIDLK